MTKHTPGPWEAHGPEVWAGQIFICDTLDSSRSPIEDMANARLIAAAPDMYEALQMVVDSWYSLDSDEYRVVQEVIAKAKSTGGATNG